MAKTAKVKKQQPALHSRAARRAASPSLNLDKSIKTMPRPSSPVPKSSRGTAKPHVLAAVSTGISKRSKSKPVKRQQRLRQARGMERAADFMEKMEVKVQKSMGRTKTVKERRKPWEELNGGIVPKKDQNPFDLLEEDENDGWVSDEEMVQVPVETQDSSHYGTGTEVAQPVVAPESIPLPIADGLEEDDIL
ncbi:uncharacterized protein BDZ99DRAFT_501340 [Mytilinidion resinicola]|uniref:Ribosome biogenesis protein Alb1 n=1 Tax=Mytilinidion resinicola TaxID=574789 RepID=A0A6A6YCG8_9PEZI|nr:uncharacterized protein BDZ99DRAFT_501340 [Mytilinidion resinicola]KAF2806526.1 hypothetical protein BDZ99DRAFT_501340 [Mytilinidion resinicola]